MLIRGAQRSARRCSFAPLAEAFRPKLHVPGAKAFHPVRIGHHDGVRDAQIFGETDGDRGSDSGRVLFGHCRRAEFLHHLAAARAESRNIKPARKGGQKANHGEDRVAPADFGAVRQHGYAARREQTAQPVKNALDLGFRHAEEDLRDEGGVAGVFDELEGRQRLRNRLTRHARFRDRDEARLRDVENAQAPHEGVGIEVVVEAQARVRLAARPIVSGDRPAAELSENLSAEA